MKSLQTFFVKLVAFCILGTCAKANISFFATTNELGYKGNVWNITDNTGPWETSSPRNVNILFTNNSPLYNKNYNIIASNWNEHSPSYQSDSFFQLYESGNANITSANGNWDETGTIFTLDVSGSNSPYPWSRFWQPDTINGVALGVTFLNYTYHLEAIFETPATLQNDFLVNSSNPVSITGYFKGEFIATIYDEDKNPITNGDVYGFDITLSMDLFDTLTSGEIYNYFGAAYQAGVLRFKSSHYYVDENEGYIRIYVSRTGGSSGSVSVNYSTANGTANSDSDYITASGTLNWSDGDTSDKYFDVSITKDGTYEDDETFTVRLSSASGAILGSPIQTTVTITDDESVLFDPNETNSLLIQNHINQFQLEHNDSFTNQGLLTYVEKASNVNDIDIHDVFYTEPNTMASKIVSLIPITNLQSQIIDFIELSKDARPFPNDPDSLVLLELSIYNPEPNEPNEPNIISENYLRFWLANNAFQGKPLTIQLVSPDPNIFEYPVWDIRNIIDKNDRILPLDNLMSSDVDPNVLLDPNCILDPNIPVKVIEPNAPYEWFTLSTNREIIDINYNGIIEYNDYLLLLEDLEKEGIFRADIASMKNNSLLLGIPDGKVDETDEKAFIVEYNKKYPDNPIINTKGMIAHWTFDKASGLIAEDSAGNNDGSINGATWALGKVDGCLIFYGDDYVDCGSSNELCPDEFTISFWMRPEAAVDQQCILGKTDNIIEGAEYAIYTFDTDKLTFNSSQSNIFLNSETSIQTSEWIHVAVTRNGTEASMYINGNLDASQAYSETSSPTGQNLKIGAINIGESSSVYFKGYLDDVRIYDNSLSESEIQDIFEDSL